VLQRLVQDGMIHPLPRYLVGTYIPKYYLPTYVGAHRHLMASDWADPATEQACCCDMTPRLCLFGRLTWLAWLHQRASTLGGCKVGSRDTRERETRRGEHRR
jgi:hypothetical protein